ncbi:hypothetical protein [Paenibacillus ginsengarvi]|uniref:Uncharacterized protein n=1 Tax=Paenibacillus ginsengarvi TaxID=400777 RepID=A0A3B0CTM0_9BACL|nr:hypothetical protein [Paenibacillus ginsengarvi]RKN86764.1 hypothetical protein D7M11_02055 [Paenibacillus ginsengarvi]
MDFIRYDKKTNVYSPLVQQYLNYCKSHPEENDKPGDIYDRFYSFLTDLLGMDEREALEETAYWMNQVCDLMD